MRILSLQKQIGRGAENKLFRAVFFISLCTFFSLTNACAQTKNSAQKSPAETKPRAANLPRVTQIDDAKIKQLLKPDGKPLLVNFWATWCVPCREEFPDLVQIDKEYRGKIDFFTISLDFIEEIERDVPKFLSEMKAEMPTYLLISTDESALISTIAKDWSGGLPFTILYNEKGEIAYFRQGKVNHEILKGEIEKNLAKQVVIVKETELQTSLFREIENSENPYQKGKDDAHKDIIIGKLQIIKYGEGTVEKSRLKKVLKDKYSVEMLEFGCKVFPGLIKYVEGYNEVAETEIKRKFGEGVLAAK